MRILNMLKKVKTQNHPNHPTQNNKFYAIQS